MANLVYLLCSGTSLLCALLLMRSYHKTRIRLLLWSAICFAGLAGTNLLLLGNVLIWPALDLASWRNGLSLLSLLFLFYGLIWDTN